MDFNNWNKETHIGLPKVNKNWSKNYMQTPVPYIFQDKLFVFYGTRDSKTATNGLSAPQGPTPPLNSFQMTPITPIAVTSSSSSSAGRITTYSFSIIP